MSERRGEEISSLPVSVSDGFLMERLEKCMDLPASRVFSDMVCMHVNTCVLRYYGDGCSRQEACGSDLIQTERAASCGVALVQVSGGEDKKD